MVVDVIFNVDLLFLPYRGRSRTLGTCQTGARVYHSDPGPHDRPGILHLGREGSRSLHRGIGRGVHLKGKYYTIALMHKLETNNLDIICQVAEAGPAAKDGKLLVGDKLVQINGVDVSEADHRDVSWELEIIKEVKKSCMN